MKCKTSLNTSISAVKRVKDPLPRPVACNCCGGVVEIVNNKEIYGKEYGKWPWVYMCQECSAYVGMHPFTEIPLGTLADLKTRKARKECKQPFESLHKTGKISRSDAYKKLAEKLCLTEKECHFGLFNVEQCEHAAAAAREIYLEFNIK